MDYTPISTRRVLVAFALTAFVALLPVFYVLLQSGHAPFPTLLMPMAATVGWCSGQGASS